MSNERRRAHLESVLGLSERVSGPLPLCKMPVVSLSRCLDHGRGPFVQGFLMHVSCLGPWAWSFDCNLAFACLFQHCVFKPSWWSRSGAQAREVTRGDSSCEVRCRNARRSRVRRHLSASPFLWAALPAGSLSSNDTVRARARLDAFSDMIHDAMMLSHAILIVEKKKVIEEPAHAS